MALDFTKPVVGDNFSTSVLPGIVQAFTALAQMLDPAVAGTLTGTPTGAFRINGVNLERFNGSAWATYTLNVAGQAASVAGWTPGPTTNFGPTWGSHFPIIKSDGVTEIGQHLDFHTITNDSAVDFSVRLSTVAGVLQANSNVVLHAANFNTYAPTLAGVGASGNWSITAANANVVPWTGVSGRPTNVSSFTNDAGYLSAVTSVSGVPLATAGATPGATQILRTDTNGHSYTGYINASHAASELASPPQFIVSNGTDNFYRRSSSAQVAAAIQASASGTWPVSISGTAAVASSVAWTSVAGRPSTVSFFTNDAAYAVLPNLAIPNNVGSIAVLYYVPGSSFTGALVPSGTAISGSELRVGATGGATPNIAGGLNGAPVVGTGSSPLTTMPVSGDRSGSWKTLCATFRPNNQFDADTTTWSLLVYPVLALRIS